MIQEAYCSFEVSKLLKEKGFDWPCRAYITLDEEGHTSFTTVNDVCKEDLLDLQYLCPTHQMAMAWLREVHGLFVSIGNDDLDYNWQIFDIKNRTKDLDPTYLTDSYAGHIKYEEAVEAALKYTLENLI